MNRERKWPFQDVIYVLASNSNQYHYIINKLRDNFKIVLKPIHVWDHNVHNIITGRREHMLIFFEPSEKAEHMLHYINAHMRGNITAIELQPYVPNS